MKYSKTFLKSVLIIILTFSIVFSSSVFANSEEPLFEIIGQSVEVKQGETVSVKFAFENNPGISLFSFNIDYDFEVLTLKEISGNSLMGGSFITNVEENFILWMNYYGDSSFNGVAFTAIFEVNDNAKLGETHVSISLPYEDSNVLNNNGDDIVPIIDFGKVLIKNEYVIGDVNCDNSVDADDITSLVSILLGASDNIVNADINNDGYVNLCDLILIKKLLSKTN